uniref:Uncharacterized protein n=1 Tax=Candidatus Kentrum sp. UNK TaxID=2126344 RepID=A0A451B476_9GAMM|nr:MAG: hypothetical protein BECKUNK1418G_GA0071005_11622 [Candidatus Kentron sp. UNK]VFK73100.1 MAG: hypothetical protein BECKUNK1418H_GA0071006_11632 [Candidatus Kentron sp. UNK]
MRIKRKVTDQKIDDFLESSFEYMARFFAASLDELQNRNANITANMLALRAKIEGGWALISRPGFSEFFFFRYVNRNANITAKLKRINANCFTASIYDEETRASERTVWTGLMKQGFCYEATAWICVGRVTRSSTRPTRVVVSFSRVMGTLFMSVRSAREYKNVFYSR